MTDYETLASDLTRAGIKATVATAHGLATRAWRWEAMTAREGAIVAAWEAGTEGAGWCPETSRVRGS